MYEKFNKIGELPWNIHDIEWQRLDTDSKALYYPLYQDTIKERLEWILQRKGGDMQEEELRIYLCELGLAKDFGAVDSKLLEVLANIYEIGLESHE